MGPSYSSDRRRFREYLARPHKEAIICQSLQEAEEALDRLEATGHRSLEFKIIGDNEFAIHYH